MLELGSALYTSWTRWSPDVLIEVVHSPAQELECEGAQPFNVTPSCVLWDSDPWNRTARTEVPMIQFQRDVAV